MPRGTVLELQSAVDVYRAISSTDKLVVMDFYAAWCGPCKVLGPVIVALAAEYPQAEFYKVDVDQVAAAAEAHAVVSLPTVVLFRDGAEVARVVGADKRALEAAVAKHGTHAA